MCPWDVEAIRAEFPILQQEVNGRPVVYLDSTASAQKPRVVIETLRRVYSEYYANVHRGIYTFAEQSTEAYEGAREKVARFIHAPEAAEVVFTRNATEALNLVAYTWGEANIGAGDRIVVTEMEHHSNLVPWQQLAKRKGAELAFVPVTDGGELDLEVLRSLLADGKTKVVAFTLMSNVLGTITPAEEIVRMAHEAGAITVLDGAQAVPHLPVDVQALDADFLAFSGHKMGSPGVGVLWGRRALLEAMPPFLYGGDMILHVEKYHSDWNEIPHKFEAGTPPIAETIALGAAVDFLTGLGMEAVHEHEQELVAYAMKRLAEVEGLHILGPGAEKRGGVVAFWMDTAHPHDIASLLDEEGICVRAGHHCAEPLHERYGVPATARASFYVYNRPDEVDALVAALQHVNALLRR